MNEDVVDEMVNVARRNDRKNNVAIVMRKVV